MTDKQTTCNEWRCLCANFDRVGISRPPPSEQERKLDGCVCGGKRTQSTRTEGQIPIVIRWRGLTLIKMPRGSTWSFWRTNDTLCYWRLSLFPDKSEQRYRRYTPRLCILLSNLAAELVWKSQTWMDTTDTTRILPFSRSLFGYIEALNNGCLLF